MANQTGFITPLKEAEFHCPPSSKEGSGTELLIVWFQLLTDLPDGKWSHCLFEEGRAEESCVFGDWEGLQLFITHAEKVSFASVMTAWHPFIY